MFLTSFVGRAADVYSRKSNAEKCVTGEYPTLHELNQIYSSYAAEQWLAMLINDFAKAQGLAEMPNSRQLDVMAQTLVDRFGYMKFTEILNAFGHLREYKFFARLDIATIIEGITDWTYNVKFDILDRIEKEKEEAARNTRSQNAISMPKDIEMKLEWINIMNDRDKAIRFMCNVRKYIGDITHDTLYYDDRTHRNEFVEQKMTERYNLQFKDWVNKGFKEQP